MNDDASSSILRGVRALVGLAEMGTPVSFGVLAAALDLPPSTAHRILATLKQAGYVAQDALTGSYYPGPAFLRAATTFAGSSTYPRQVREAMSTLVEHSGESVYYGIYLSEMKRFRFLAQFFSDHAIQYVARKDKHYSILWGASGRSIAAFLPDRTVKDIYDRERHSREGNELLPAWGDLRRQLARIRQDGYCETRSQRFQGAHSVAAPIFGEELVVGCLGISLPDARYEESRVKEIGKMVVDACKELSGVARSAIDLAPADIG